MPSPREVREANEREALLDQLDDDTRAMVEAGDIIITETGQGGRPVLVEADSKKFVKGTGRPQNANDIGAIGKATAFKRTSAYREAWEEFFALGGEEGARTFSDLVEKLWWAAQGAPQLAKCHHVGCGKMHLTVLKPDAKVLMQMVESFVGKRQQVEHTGGIEHLHELLLGGGQPTGPVTVWTQDPRGGDSPDDRRQILIEDGTINKEWFDDARLLDEPDGPELPPPPENPIAD